MPIRGWQLSDVLGAVAHDAGEVAGVVQTAHDDAVQVHGLDEVAEQCTLQSQHVPPARTGRQCGARPGGRSVQVPTHRRPAVRSPRASSRPRAYVAPSSRPKGRASWAASDPAEWPPAWAAHGSNP